MIRVISLITLLWLASSAKSQDKPDPVGPQTSGTTPITTSYVGDTTNGPVWTRPAEGSPPTSLGSSASSPYQVREIEILEEGLFTVTGTWSGWDGFLCLYRSPFNCVDQLTNVLACRDGPVGSSQVGVNLLPGNHVVVATAFSTASGSYAIDIAGPAAALLLEEPSGACVLGSLCGNGVVDPGEECDDGNDIDDDDCSNQCLLPVHLLDPDIGLTKSLTSGEPYTQPGDLLVFELVAQNTGNAILDDVLIDDTLISTLDCNPAQPATLAPDEQMICIGDYFVGIDDMEVGSVTNLATASGLARGTLSVDASDSVTIAGGCEFGHCGIYSDRFEDGR